MRRFQSSRMVTEVLTDEQIARVAPSVFARGPKETTTSEHYRFVPSFEVLAGLRANGFLPVRAQQTRAADGNRLHTKHMLRFRHQDHLEHQGLQSVIPEVVLMNAHDGTCTYQLFAGLYRLVCLNGMVVGEDSFSLRVKHQGQNTLVREVIDASYEIIESFPQVIGSVQTMQTQLVTEAQSKAYARAALTLRYGVNEDGVTVAPIEPEALLQVRRREDSINSVWGVMNVTQENLLKGGVQGRTQTNKKMKTRPINSVVEDMRINKGLWVLARELERAVAA